MTTDPTNLDGTSTLSPETVAKAFQRNQSKQEKEAARYSRDIERYANPSTPGQERRAGRRLDRTARQTSADAPVDTTTGATTTGATPADTAPAEAQPEEPKTGAEEEEETQAAAPRRPRQSSQAATLGLHQPQGRTYSFQQYLKMTKPQPTPATYPGAPKPKPKS